MEYIMSSKPLIKSVDKMKFFSARNKLLEGKKLSKEESEVILDFYVSEARNAMAEVLGLDLENDPLINKCDVAQKLLGSSLEKVGVTVYPKETRSVISNECLGHSFLVVRISDNDYLVDITYRQFFIKENCDIDRLNMVDDLVIESPDPGYFASREPIRGTAKTILEKGYAPLNGTTAKHYCDTFYFSKRGRGPYSNIEGNTYLNSLLKETHDYSIDDKVLKSRGFKGV